MPRTVRAQDLSRLLQAGYAEAARRVAEENMLGNVRRGERIQEAYHTNFTWSHRQRLNMFVNAIRLMEDPNA